MTPKQKAFELITKFQHPMSEMSDTDCLHIAVAKEFSLIAVEEILDLKHIVTLRRNMHEMELEYWDEVKKEIEAL
jgi:hypothetical protein